MVLGSELELYNLQMQAVSQDLANAPQEDKFIHKY